MISLKEETLYLQGARDVLMRLRDDYAMYLVPSVKLNIKEENVIIIYLKKVQILSKTPYKKVHILLKTPFKKVYNIFRGESYV